jgi:hypothetical protein
MAESQPLGAPTGALDEESNGFTQLENVTPLVTLQLQVPGKQLRTTDTLCTTMRQFKLASNCPSLSPHVHVLRTFAIAT